MKNDFLYRKVEKSSQQHCWEWQNAPPFPIWAHCNKLCHKYGHNYIIWLANQESSYTIVCFVWRHFVFHYPITCLLFSLSTSTHISTPCGRVLFFEVFFIFIYLFQNQVKMVDMIIHTKGLNISVLSLVYVYNK